MRFLHLDHNVDPLTQKATAVGLGLNGLKVPRSCGRVFLDGRDLPLCDLLLVEIEDLVLESLVDSLDDKLVCHFVALL